MLNWLCGDGSSLSWAKSKEPVRAERSSADPTEKWRHSRPFRGQTILLSGGGTGRRCSPRGASNYHQSKGYPRLRLESMAPSPEPR